MSAPQGLPPLTVGVFVNVIPEYRIPALELLASKPGIRLVVLRTEGGEWAAARPGIGPIRGARSRELPVRPLKLGPLTLVRTPSLMTVLHEEKVDVLLAEARMGLTDVVRIASFPADSSRGRPPIVWWFAGWRNTDRSRLVVALSDLITSGIVRRGAGAACYCSSAASRARELGLPPARIVVAQNAIDTAALETQVDLLGPSSAPFGRSLRLLFVGQLLERKKLDWVLDALAEGDKKMPQPLLRVVGGGPARERLVERTRLLGLQSSVEFRPATYDPVDLAAHVTWADVGVLPHAGGLMLNTCMAAGLPVICGVADGTETDLVRDGQTGWLMQGEGSEAVARALERVWIDRRAIPSVGSRARQLVGESASLESMVDGLLAAIRMGTTDFAAFDSA